MKHYIVRQTLIARLAALALCGLCLLQAPARGQGMTGYIVMFPSAGLARGESLRLTLFNPGAAPVRVQAQLRHPGGILAGMADGSVRFVQPGISCSFDFKRSDIPLVGEEGTGRLQLRASFYIRMAGPGRLISLPSQWRPFRFETEQATPSSSAKSSPPYQGAAVEIYF